MGANVSNLTDHVPKMGAFHCAMIGLDSSGKTTVLYRLKYNQYMNTAPTIGFNCEKFRINGTAYTVWDVGGQDKLRPLWRSYTRCTDGIIFVIDSTKEDRMEEAKLELLKICKSNTSTKNGQIPILLLANKQDLPSALDECKIEAALGLKKELGNSFQWHLQPICAVTGEGLDEGMEMLHTMITHRRKLKKSTSGLIKNPNSQISSQNGGSSDSKTVVKPSRKVQRSHSHHVLSRS